MENLSKLQSELRYNFSDSSNLVQALTHKSYANERSLVQVIEGQKKRKDNELFEFLGDAVLDLAISELLMEIYPQDNEGSLSKKRASLVNETVLADFAMKYGLNEALLLGKGEKSSGGNTKPRLLACALEAVIGAVFIEGGYKAAKEIVYRCFKPLVKDYESLEISNQDFKTRLQEYTQSKFKETPAYDVYWSFGPAHDRLFFAQIYLQGKWITRAKGKSKKTAEQAAACSALEVLNEL
ncbi:MAG: ribonuclease III [Bdellovibrionales bacterium]